jgi:hypothetical protein
MSVIKTFRLLKRDQPDRAKVEKLFAKKSDQVLLGAIANPEHSEAAVQILQSLANERGLQGEVDQGWTQTEESMYVAPFGKQPGFEDVLAAPGRRRRLYRSLQIIMALSLIVSYFAFFHFSPYSEWVQHGIDNGQVNPSLIARFRQVDPPPSDGKIYSYLHGLKLFVKDLRQTYVDILLEDNKLDPVFVQQYVQTEGASRESTNIEIIETFDEMSNTSDELGSYIYETKALAYEQAINAINLRYEAGVKAGVMDAPLDHSNVEAYVELSPFEVDFIDANNGGNSGAFDHFAQSAEFEPEGPKVPTSESLGVALLIGGPTLWFFGGIFSWIRPYRILLLRPFQSKKISGPLKRFMKKNVSFYGHTITLSDKYLKESRLEYITFWVPRSVPDIFVLILFILPPIRQFKRWIRVGSASSYQFLQNRMARRFTMNMFWQNAFNGNKLLKVKCSDTWWKQCVDLLMYSSQLIIVDLSWVKVGTKWELDKIDRRDLERKTLFVVGEDAAGYAHEIIAKFWPHDEASPPLYVYRNSGMLLDREAFHRDVARIISESHLWEGVHA